MDTNKKKPHRDRRRHPVGRNPILEARRERADARAEARATRSPEEQLVMLDYRPGKSARERKRLSA